MRNLNSEITIRIHHHQRTEVLRFVVMVLTVAFSWSTSAAQDLEGAAFGFTFRNSALEERFTRSRTEEEPVVKSLLNSDVTGQQTTITTTRLKLVPSNDGIRFDVINSGLVSSQTTGINPQALVESNGQQRFEAIKPFWFDGNQFLTKPAFGTVEASQTPQRVVSAVGTRMPMFRRIGDRIAWNQVVRRGGEINQAVAEDVSRDVFPKVDRIVDNDFAELGQQWKSLQAMTGPLSAEKNFNWAARSSQTLSTVWAVDRSARVAGSVVPRPVRTLEAGEDIAFFVTEESVNRMLARYVRGGFRLSDQQLQSLQSALEPQSNESLATVISRIQTTVRRLQSERTEALLFSIELPAEKPLQVRFRDGDVRLVTTFQVLPKLGNASGWMTTSFNLRGKRLSDRDWTMSVRGVDVNPLESEAEQKSVAGPPELDLRIPNNEANPEDATTVQAGTVWDTVVRSAVEGLSRKVPEMPLPLEFSTGDALPGAKSLRIVQVDSNRGVLRCSFRFR